MPSVGELDALRVLTEFVYEEAGYTTAEAVPTVHLARRILGPQSVRVICRDELQTTRGALVRFDRAWRIFVRDDVAPNEVSHLVGHELAHWALRHLGGGDDSEPRANLLGAMLVAPRVALRAAIAAHGFDPVALALVFGTTQTAIVLRHGEANGARVAVQRPGLTYTRGPWRPSPREVEAAMRTHYGQVIPITDAPSRRALVLSA